MEAKTETKQPPAAEPVKSASKKPPQPQGEKTAPATPKPKTASEQVYTIPLREAFKKARKKRVPYAMRLVRTHLQQQTKSENVKIGQHLNEKLWEKSIEKPPRRVRVHVVKDGKEIRAELMGFEYKEFKAKKKKEKTDFKGKLMSRLGGKAAQKEALEKMIEGTSEKQETKTEQTQEPMNAPSKPKEQEAPSAKTKPPSQKEEPGKNV